MKNLRLFTLFTVYAFVFLSACKEEEDPAVIVKARLLAGNTGQSKSWILTTFTAKVNTDPILNLFDEFELEGCMKDNIYTFTNNTTQNFECTEGATKCSTEDTDLVEEGAWFLTNDAKGATINLNLSTLDTNNFPVFAILFLDFGIQPTGVIKQLTDTTFQCEFVYSDDEDTIIFNLTFTKV
jgi:hypothetical protein